MCVCVCVVVGGWVVCVGVGELEREREREFVCVCVLCVQLLQAFHLFTSLLALVPELSDSSLCLFLTCSVLSVILSCISFISC